MLAMTARTASRASSSAASTSATAAAKRTLTTSPPPSTTGKRARYAPAPLAPREDDRIASPSSSIGPYSLRRRVASASSSLAAKEEKPLPTVKDEDNQDSSFASLPLTPRKAGKKAAVKKEEKDPFATSPRKTNVKPIKIDLDPSESRPAPKRWEEQYAVLTKQRKRIIAPVDTLGCEENGKDEKRRDNRDVDESDEKRARRERFTLLISLMLSSQTKDPVTAEAVHNLQRELPNGLCLDSLLAASQDEVSRNINKVGFWRRKTGYIQSAARIIRDDFDGDVPKTIDELCSLPGVGPKMGFLALQGAWGLNVGIGVDVHVHRVANRLRWVKSNDPEGTRLQLQSWLPKEMHRTINKTLVGFGQVICQPVGPRCDLCALGAARLCPSYRKVDPKSIASRVKVELLPDIEDEEQGALAAAVKEEVDQKDGPAVAVKLEGGPDGPGVILAPPAVVKEEGGLDW